MAAMATTVRTNAAVLVSRVTPRLENVCVALEELETTVANVGISIHVYQLFTHFIIIIIIILLAHK